MQESLDAYAPELFHVHSVDNTDTGYRVPAVVQIVGVTYRQLDHWARTGLVEPSVRAATGSGSQRIYSFRDLLVLKIVKRLLDTGISLQQIRVAIDHLRDRGTRELASTHLFSDGATVYECTSEAEVFDLLRGGQGVFGIAVGPTLTELAGQVANMPSEDATSAEGVDELARRRSRRARTA